ncbi:4-hydroxy-tetrahydrodipicolinate synthase [Marinobacterium arenosum]|uniref:4-hydroxy-tetrahydrodipicolinate synthase n=1 Tax=Marinobacterium arenosum TaxID=2862496 RepID=UPI001C95948E|nr:4-hydroxy-tetrahydrodipicolinate synthase [Marinobacterium arenosum]MBY4678268.1 4-hydroxy-tetrahydrodipicolinate synthase [Marinobacterium arenosum]
MFRGSYVALITPFRDGAVDEAALRKMVNWQIESGTHGLVPVGTTGESPTLSETEHKRVIEIVVEETAGRVPVVAGAGSNNPAEAVEYSRHAQDAGADAILSVAGYYNRPNQEGLYQQFKMIHDAIEIPVIIYNIPPRAVVDVQPATMARLAELPRVVGVKDATGDLARISLERMAIDGEFSFLSGEDMTAVAYNASGGHGCISVTANVAPALCAQMQEACQSGNYAQALEIHDRLAPLHKALFAEPSPAGVKYAASLLGLCNEDARLPIVPMSEAGKANVKAALEFAGLL